jgi:hypothetical protein
MTHAKRFGSGILGITLLVSACGGSMPTSGSGSGHGGSGGSSGSAGTGGSAGAGGPGDGSGNPGAPGPGDIFPSPAFAGFDGTHPYLVPLETDLSGTVTWAVSDPTVATIAPIDASKIPPTLAGDGGQWAMVTAKKAGTITVSASGGGSTATGKLTIGAYDAASWTAGQTRWMTAPTGIIACTSCHTGASAVDNTPSYTAEFSDTELIGMFTLGQYPDGTPLRAPNHMFTLTDAEKNGLVTYLRSLAPKGF